MAALHIPICTLVQSETDLCPVHPKAGLNPMRWVALASHGRQEHLDGLSRRCTDNGQQSQVDVEKQDIGTVRVSILLRLVVSPKYFFPDSANWPKMHWISLSELISSWILFYCPVTRRASLQDDFCVQNSSAYVPVPVHKLPNRKQTNEQTITATTTTKQKGWHTQHNQEQTQPSKNSHILIFTLIINNWSEDICSDLFYDIFKNVCK